MLPITLSRTFKTRKTSTFNNSSDIDFKDVMNLHKKRIAKKYSFQVNDSNLASDNPLPFRRNLLERI